MNASYLIPANSKRGNLIFGWFRPIDLIIFCTGVTITILLLVIFSSNTSGALLLTLIPAGICTSLIMPVPNQHNVLVFIGAIFKFFTSQQKYKWKGWSFYESFKEEK